MILKKVTNIVYFYKKIFQLTEQFKFNYIFLIISILLVTILELFTFVSILVLVDVILGNENHYIKIIYEFFEIFFNQVSDSFIYLFIIFTFLLRICFVFISNTYQNFIIKKISIYLSTNVFRKIFNQKYKDYLKTHSGNFVASIDNANTLVSIIRSTLHTLSDLFLFLFILLYLVNLSYNLSLIIMFVFTFIILIYFYSLRNKFRKISDDKKKYNFKKTSFQQDVIKSFFEIKLFSAEETIFSKFHQISNNYYDVIYKNNVLSIIPRLMLEFTIISLIVLMPIVLLEIYNLNFENYSSILIAFVIASLRFLPLISRMSISIQEILVNRKNLENYFQFFNSLTEEINENINQNDFQKEIFKERLILKNISFKFNNNLIFNDVNLEIKKNEKIIINGENGSGKSTLLNIISGLLVPSSGEILYDNFKSDINMYGKIGYVSQSPLFIDESIINNIALGKSDKDIDRNFVKELLKKVNLLDVIEKLDKSIDTNLGENAKIFSGGQKQRIAIARALYIRPQILLLDEVTSALDEKNENIILNLLLNLVNVTTVWISHKNYQKYNFDRSYLIKDKKLYEEK